MANAKDDGSTKNSAVDWEKWDPMIAHSESFMNTMSFKIEEGALNRGSDVQFKNIQCPFQKEPNKPCFKGNSCRYMHGKYTPEILKQHPKLADGDTQNILLALNLPKKNIPADGFVSYAWVTTVIDPSEFYIVPQDNWSCLCQSYHSDDESQHGDNHVEQCGFDCLNGLYRSMQYYFNVSKKLPNVYIAGEIVAVRLELNTGKGWFRAVVLDDVVEEDESDKAPIINIKLLDFGLEIRKSTLDVVPLPRNFAYVGPMAFKCQLFGISPLLGTWGKKATKLFKELISGQIVIAEVKRTVHPDVDGIFNLFEKSPILLNLFVKHGGKFVNVTKQMGDLGLGIEWNPYPCRPSVNTVLPRWEYEYAVQEIKTQEDQSSLETVLKKVMNREKSRMDRYVEKLKCQHNMD